MISQNFVPEECTVEEVEYYFSIRVTKKHARTLIILENLCFTDQEIVICKKKTI